MLKEVITLLGIYVDKTVIQNNVSTRVFIAALCTIAKTWKQPECPTTDEWTKKMWHINTMKHDSITRKNEIMPFVATWLQLEIIILSEANQTEKDKYHLYVESKKSKK